MEHSQSNYLGDSDKSMGEVVFLSDRIDQGGDGTPFFDNLFPKKFS